MNPTKTRFKIDMAEDFGRKFEGMEEEAERSFHRQEGARDALKSAAQPVASLMELIDQDLKDGGLPASGDPVEVAKYAKRWLKRALGALDNLATKAEVARIAAEGRRKGLEDAKQFAFKVWEDERGKLEAYLKAVEEERDGDGESDDVPGGHPGPSLKSQRQAEEKQKESAPPAETPKGPKKPNPLASKEKAPPKKAAKKAAQKKTASKPAKKRLRDPKKKR